MTPRASTAVALAALGLASVGRAQDAPETGETRLARLADEILPELQALRGLRQGREVRKEFLD
ncbi:MAG: hypothetical protein L0216_19675, partial [Planctomycetales bacterium]|nr:hypothetical protein [Planctomycetales bacterium]